MDARPPPEVPGQFAAVEGDDTTILTVELITTRISEM
jgi:hypothetical protein